jgi:uncharacterized peroxidase-related enzyme
MMAHGEDLRQITGDDALVTALLDDYRQASLSPRHRVMLDYAVRLAGEPKGMDACHLVPLRAAGLSDTDILNLVQVVGFFSYYNRLVEGLGVATEAFMPPRNSR